MRLATVRVPGQDRHQTSLAALTDIDVTDLSDAVPRWGTLTSVDALCAALAADPDGGLAILQSAASGLPPRWALGEVELLAPLRQPGKIVCVGLNYADHCREVGIPEPDHPVIFAKFASAIVGPDETVVLHADVTTELDWEVELVAVVGEHAGPDRRATQDMLLGYTIGNDVSARDLQRADGQWVRAKSLDTMLPLGPVVVTTDEISDPAQLKLGMNVNDAPQQSSSTAEMIFDIDYLLAWLTSNISLEPGDLLLTGTPHGTGAFQQPPRFLADGDVMEAWIEQIGSLRNPIATAAALLTGEHGRAPGSPT